MLTKEQLQHNTVLVGNRSELAEEIKRLFGDEVIYYEKSDFELSVEDIREVRRWIVKVGGEPVVAILSSFYWNEEVQNALLKIVEDTPAGCTIFLLGHQKSFFLPTILSRTQFLEFPRPEEYLKLAKSLLAQEPCLRLQDSKLKKVLAQKVTSQEDDSERKDREAQIILFENLFAVIVGVWKGSKDKFDKDLIHKLIILSEHIYNYGGNPALSIEFLLLTTPVIV